MRVVVIRSSGPLENRQGHHLFSESKVQARAIEEAVAGSRTGFDKPTSRSRIDGRVQTRGCARSCWSRSMSMDTPDPRGAGLGTNRSRR